MPLEAASHTGQRDRDEQKKLEQLEWDRLQREALAAQRDRLEQEMLQAKKQGLLSTADIESTDIAKNNDHEPFLGIHWNHRWILAGIVLLMIGGIIVEVLRHS